MQTWHELESKFSELIPAMFGARVDGQWGSAGEFWRVAACHDVNVRKRFEALALIAGQKLLKMLQPGNNPDDELLNETDPVVRWYKGLWKISGNLEYRTPGQELDDDGNVVGHIHSGTIRNVADASATFCLELVARHPEEQAKPVTSQEEMHLQDRAQGFWDKYGVPIIIAVIATVVGGLLLALIL
jgi:hypothetical protein